MEPRVMVARLGTAEETWQSNPLDLDGLGATEYTPSRHPLRSMITNRIPLQRVHAPQRGPQIGRGEIRLVVNFQKLVTTVAGQEQCDEG